MSKESIYFDLQHSGNQHDSEKIKRQLDTIPGVLSVSISRGRETVAVDYDTSGTNPDRLREELQKCGCAITGEHIENHTM